MTKSEYVSKVHKYHIHTIPSTGHIPYTGHTAGKYCIFNTVEGSATVCTNLLYDFLIVF